MSAAPRWITLSAISVLGVGMLASGAIGVANAMPLVDSSTTAEVPPISTAPGEGKSSADSLDLMVPEATSVLSAPAPSSSPAVEQAPAPEPQPVAPRPAATADDSPVSPASVDD